MVVKMMNNSLSMPVKVKPFDHQKQAFDFICDMFGLTDFEEKSSGAALPILTPGS